MAESMAGEVIKLIKDNLNRYKEWIKPDPDDPVVLTVIKTIFKALTALFFVAFSPIVLLILIFAFLAAL